ncbi:MAG TPA: alpha/beta hydrolase [Solirubrobacteraceae bacterium]|nr:alpha/beta hydrolase [Solirubrobacteraceae bacterium]
MPTATSVLSDLHHELRGSGPAVLFIAGASGDAGHFARTAERLADEFTIGTYDRRGCSRSARLDEGEFMSIASQADDAAALIEELGLAPAIVFGTSGGGSIALELVARRPELVRAAIVHEPALIALVGKPEAGDFQLGPIVELAATDPRRAMEAFLRTQTSDTTFEGLDPQHRERCVGNGAHFFSRELATFAGYVPDAERLMAGGVPLRMLVSQDGSPQLVRATARFAEQLGVAVERISGNHAPYLRHPEAFAEELRPMLRELSRTGMQRINGVRLVCEERGQGAPILCIHGTGGTSLAWSDAVDELSRLGRVIAYDRRGCARSQRPAAYERTSVSEHADDAAALLDALAAAPAVVVGRSYGGSVAIDLALRYPDRVRALVLLEPDAPRELAPAAAAWIDALADRLRGVAARDGVDAVAEALVTEVAGGDAWRSFPDEIRRVMTGNGAAILAEVEGEWWPQTDAAGLASIQQPALLVAAAGSPPEFHEPIDVLAQALPGARTVLVDGGHLIDPAGPEVIAFIEEEIT